MNRTIKNFKKYLKMKMSFKEVKDLFGEPDADMGSGLHIFKYKVEDKMEIWLGFANLMEIQYAKLVDSQGNMTEILLK